ncbi:MAG: DUF6493 family protein [Bacteroidia bacterium]|nr:DUF6493 family protein [Bacteroidia bacterium]
MLKEQKDALIDQFLVLIHYSKQVIPFLKNLDNKEKKALVPTIKKLGRFHNSWDQKAKTKILDSLPRIIAAHGEGRKSRIIEAGFICCTLKDYQRLDWSASNHVIDGKYEEKILSWYVPSWFSELINEDPPWRLDYLKIIEWTEMDILQPSDALIAQKLVGILTERNHGFSKEPWAYKLNVLETYPQTLEDHIWKVFEHPTSINLGYYAADSETNRWHQAFHQLVDEGKLPRERVMKGCLAAQSRDLDRNLSIWFMNLFNSFEPKEEELLILQEEFFIALNSPYSKVINDILKIFKGLVKKSAFDHRQFIQQAPELLTSETKSIVTSSLMILDKLGRKWKDLKGEVCLLATEAYIHQDKNIQVRVSKLVKKYGAIESDELKLKILEYAPFLFYEAKELVGQWLDPEEEEEMDDFLLEEYNVLEEGNKLAEYENFDDILFFLNQSLDRNELIDLELALSYLPKLHRLLEPQLVNRLEPFLKRALDSFGRKESWSVNRGDMEFDYYRYLNDYGKKLMNDFPAQMENYRDYRRLKREKFKEEHWNKDFYLPRLKPIDGHKPKANLYFIFWKLMMKSKNILESGHQLELLSKPTHRPCWIDPKIFIKRIKNYEANRFNIDFYDLQLAFLRLAPESNAKITEADLAQIQKGELGDMLNYHLGYASLPQAARANLQLWLPLILIRNEKKELEEIAPLLELEKLEKIKPLHWEAKATRKRERQFNYTSRKMEDSGDFYIERKLVFQADKSLLIKSNISPFIKQAKKFLGMNTESRSSILGYVTYLEDVNSYFEPNSFDTERFLYFFPSYPEHMVRLIIKKNLVYSQYSGEVDARNIASGLRVLNETWHRGNYGEEVFVLLAGSFLHKKKICKELALETWIKAVSLGKMDSVRLGRTLGKMESVEFAPLKRFTDIIFGGMLDVSSLHKKALFELLNAMIPLLPDQAIKNTKKLLDAYFELKQELKVQELDKTVIVKLECWKEVSSLKSLINKNL